MLAEIIEIKDTNIGCDKPHDMARMFQCFDFGERIAWEFLLGSPERVSLWHSKANEC